MMPGPPGDDTCRIAVRVRARASENCLVPVDDGTFRARTTAAPVDGKANESVRRMLALHFGVPRTAVTLIRGARSRDKVFDVQRRGNERR
jgi:uncharacterized protein YggU (UPF0235/DUF167 family)